VIDEELPHSLPVYAPFCIVDCTLLRVATVCYRGLSAGSLYKTYIFRGLIMNLDDGWTRRCRVTVTVTALDVRVRTHTARTLVRSAQRRRGSYCIIAFCGLGFRLSR